jgi:quinol monooxygenase YgiN
MSDQVSWLVELAVKPGQLEKFHTLTSEMVKSAHGEAGVTIYERFVSRGGRIVYAYERYVDSAAALAHLGKFEPQFSERFVRMVSRKRFTVFGAPTDELKRVLNRFGATSCGFSASRRCPSVAMSNSDRRPRHLLPHRRLTRCMGRQRLLDHRALIATSGSITRAHRPRHQPYPAYASTSPIGHHRPSKLPRHQAPANTGRDGASRNGWRSALLKTAVRSFVLTTHSRSRTNTSKRTTCRSTGQRSLTTSSTIGRPTKMTCTLTSSAMASTATRRPDQAIHVGGV